MQRDESSSTVLFRPTFVNMPGSKQKLQRNIAPITKVTSFEPDECIINHTKADEFVPAEKMYIFHERLKQECDKIARKQNDVELELKQKDWKLQEANTVLESLRKSMIELQHENEKLSLKLQDEITGRAEIIQRVRGSRDMCVFLKDYTNKMEKIYQDCLEEKNTLSAMQQEITTQLKDMCSKISQLQLKSESQYESFSNQVKNLEEEKKNVIFQYDSKIIEAEKKHDILVQVVNEKDINCRQLQIELEKLHSDFNHLQISFDALNSKFSDNELRNDELKVQLEKINDELVLSKLKNSQFEFDIQSKGDKLCSLEDELMKKQEDFEKTIKIRDDCIHALHDDIANNKQQVIQLKYQIAEFSKSLTEKEEELISSKILNDKLTKDNANAFQRVEQMEILQNENKVEINRLETVNKNLRETVNLQEDTIEELRRDVSELTESNKRSEGEIRAFHIKVSMLQEDLCKFESVCEIKQQIILDLRNELKSETDEKQSALNNVLLLQSDISEAKSTREKVSLENNELKLKFQEALLTNDQLTLELGRTLDEKIKLCIELDEERKQILQLEDNMQVLKQNLLTKQQEEQQLKKDLENSNKEKIAVMEELEQCRKTSADMKIKQETELTEHMKMIETLQRQIEALETKNSKTTENSGEKLKTLKADVVTKNKNIRDLEKQLKVAKQEINSQMLHLEEKSVSCAKLTDALSHMKDDVTTLQKQLSDEIALNASNKEQLEILERERNQARSALEDATKRYDAKMKDVECVLEKYKLDNEQIVTRKNKQLQEATKKAERATEAENEIDQLKRELEQLTNLLDMKSNELDLKMAIISDLEKRTTDLQSAQLLPFNSAQTPSRLKDTKVSNLSSSKNSVDQSVEVGIPHPVTPNVASLDSSKVSKSSVKTPGSGRNQLNLKNTPRIVNRLENEDLCKQTSKAKRLEIMDFSETILVKTTPLRTSTPQPHEEKQKPKCFNNATPSTVMMPSRLAINGSNHKKVTFTSSEPSSPVANSSHSSFSLSFEVDKNCSKAKLKETNENVLDASGRKRVFIKSSTNWFDKKTKLTTVSSPQLTSIRKCAAKNSGKYFANKQWTDKSSKLTKKTTEDHLWLDDDATFGLGFEDF